MLSVSVIKQVTILIRRCVCSFRQQFSYCLLSSPAGVVVTSLSDQPTLKDVVCFAVPRVAPKWYDLGLALDVKPFVLDTIFQQQKCPDQPRTMLVKWLEGSPGTGSQPRTWQTVLDAVGMICGSAAMEDIRTAVQTPRIKTAGVSLSPQ